MAQTEMFLEDEIHPIDIVEHLAEHHEWEFDRIEENPGYEIDFGLLNLFPQETSLNTKMLGNLVAESRPQK